MEVGSPDDLLRKIDPNKRELLERRISTNQQPTLSSSSINYNFPPNPNNKNNINENNPLQSSSSSSGSEGFGDTIHLSQSIQHSFPSTYDLGNNTPEDSNVNSPPPPKELKRKRCNFTAEEDSMITKGVQQFGKDWERIIDKFQMDRTKKQVQSRFKRLKKSEDSDSSTRRGSRQVSSARRKPGDVQKPQLTKDQELEQREKMLEGKEREMDRREREMERKESDVSSLEDSLKEKERGLIKFEEDLVRRHRNLSDNSVVKERFESLKECLAEHVYKCAMMERDTARRTIRMNSDKFGNVTMQRRGTTFDECWQDGEAFKLLKHREHALNELTSSIANDLKEIQKQKRTRTEECDLLDLVEEQLKGRKRKIEKEKQEIQSERAKLNLKKALHLRELKRITDEDHSPFNGHPLLKEKYVLQTLLGKGGFSEVYKAFDLETLQEVSCKIHSLNPQWTEQKKGNYIKHALREYRINKQVKHPKIIRLLDVFEIDETNFCTVLEYVDGMDLDMYLKTHDDQRLPEKEARCIIAQVFSALKYLNERSSPIIHYDLKPGNILVEANGGIKITDFGLSKILESGQSSLELTSQGAGTYWYLPPECFEVGQNGPPKISNKVDVWSAGVIFYQMLYGRKPFGHNQSQHSILTDNVIKNTHLEFPPSPKVSPEAKEFLKKLLYKGQVGRPDVTQCYNEPYLSFAKTIKVMGPPS